MYFREAAGAESLNVRKGHHTWPWLNVVIGSSFPLLYLLYALGRTYFPLTPSLLKGDLKGDHVTYRGNMTTTSNKKGMN